MDTPMKGRPADVLDDLEQIILEAIERDDISQFYIGCSMDLKAAQERHGSDEVIPLYEASSGDLSVEVAESLLKTFYNHPKCENESEHSERRLSPSGLSYVYAAIWSR